MVAQEVIVDLGIELNACRPNHSLVVTDVYVEYGWPLLAFAKLM